MKNTFFGSLTMLLSFSGILSAADALPVEIGQRRELMIDDALIESVSGSLELRLHHPQAQEIAIVHDRPWEGSGCGYHSIFHDGEKYRMYYKAWHIMVEKGKLDTKNRFLCYAESEDGIIWTKPELGLFEYEGSKKNNIVIWDGGPWGEAQPDGAHPAVFLDQNPNCPPEARFKAIIRSNKPTGLLVMKSADGIRWSMHHDKPVITDGAFDSQNLAFWDPVRNEYRAYWRIFTNGIRDIRTATSKDLITWTPHHDLKYEDAPPEHLYVNQILPYYRAPHLFIGFPARYIERDGKSPSMGALPDPEHRELRAAASPRYGYAITEGLLMSSRDAVNFHRWPEAFLRPGPERTGQWKYGDNYIAWHLLETKSKLPGAPHELSIYATEGYWTGKQDELRRYTLRLDGFVSANAKMSGGELVTKPVIFSGKELTLNFSSSAAGDLRVAIQNVDGTSIPGFSLDDCPPVFGDSVDRIVQWKNGSDVSALAGKPVRLRFSLHDADLYSYQFR
ncbi:MAG: hypothetical protein KBF76_06890 [Verrucomicrobiales bacterium]|nr:hypothetical protein [Verrucomicrobiales bacterium]